MNKLSSLKELQELVQKNGAFSHEIKGKRLKKELKSLDEQEFQGVTLNEFNLSNVAISISIRVQLDQKKSQNFILRLDREYPFNQPQIFYHPKEKSENGYCKDLLINLLTNQVWGPSLTLTVFIQKISSLAMSIHNKQKLRWTYHNLFEYGKDELLGAGFKLFQVEQYRWEYKIVKLKKKKILGLTPDCILKFDDLSDGILVLDFWSSLKDIIEVNADFGKKNYNLEISHGNPEKPQKMYLGGNTSDMEAILNILNPIQMIQRKVTNFQKNGITNYDEAIKNYSTLIEHYSLINQTTSNKYMNSMKKLIESHYSEKQNGPNQAPEIVT